MKREKGMKSMSYKPWYNRDTNFQTSSKDVMDYLARSNKFLETLVEDYEAFQLIIVEELKRIKFDAEMSVEDILRNWLTDGTLERIINQTLFDTKADKDWVSEQLTLIKEDVKNQLDDTRNAVNTQVAWYSKALSHVRLISDYPVDNTGQNDSLSGFKQALEDTPHHGELWLEPKKTYRLSDMLELITDKTITLVGNGATLLSDVIGASHDVGRALSFKGQHSHDVTLSGGLQAGKKIITVSSTSNINVNDVLYVQSDESFNNARSYYKKGGVVTVGKVLSGTQIQLNESFPYAIASSVITKISVIKPVTVHIKDLIIKGNHSSPIGYIGLAIENSLNSTVTGVYSDNFNHCFHFRKHVNTIATHLKSGRSFMEGRGESYGLASYMGTHFSLSHSTLNSGRHGLDISGFENSFKTNIEHVTASSETDNVGFNLHQSSYDVTVKNCHFDSIGLAGHVTMEHCLIDNKTISNLKTSNRYDHSSYNFIKCHFTGNPNVIRITDDAQTQPNNVNSIGAIRFDHCQIETRLQLNLSVTYFMSVVDILTIKDTNNFNININDGCRINRAIIENCSIEHDQNFINGDTGRISELVLRDCKLRQRYDSIIMNSFETILFDNVTVDTLNPASDARFSITAKDGAGIPVGRVTLSNSDLSLYTLSTGGFRFLTLINSQLTTPGASGRNNITTYQGTELVNLNP